MASLKELRIRRQALVNELTLVDIFLDMQREVELVDSLEALRVDAPACRVVWSSPEGNTYGEIKSANDAYLQIVQWLVDQWQQSHTLTFEDQKAIISDWRPSANRLCKLTVWIEEVVYDRND